MTKEELRRNGEYDPPYIINPNPTPEQIEVAKKILKKYEKKIKSSN